MAHKNFSKFAGAVINENGGDCDNGGSSIFGGKQKQVNNGPKVSSNLLEQH